MTSATGGLAGYLTILRSGGAVRPFAASVVARLPFSMAPLGIVLLVQHVRGSYGVAGFVTGTYALGTAVGSPLWGGAIDRFGQVRVVVPTVLTSAGMLAALAVSTVAGADDAVLLALSGLAGLFFPPFTAAMRSTWRVVLPDPRLLRAGFALDAVSVETIFVGGPLLLSLLLVLTPPVVPLLVTAALLAGGGVAYCAAGAVRHPSGTDDPATARSATAHPAADDPTTDGSATDAPTTDDPATDHPATGSPADAPGAVPPPTALPGTRLAVAAAGLPLLLFVSAAMSVGFGAIDTSLAATAREVLGDEGRLGLLFAAIAGGSAIGGLYYGTMASHAHEQRRLPLTLGVFALGLSPLPLLLTADRPPLWTLMPLLFVAGLAIAPSLIILQNLVDSFAPLGRVNEAQAWLSTAVTTGAAAGTAAAGTLIDAAGVTWSFAGAAGAVAAACLLAVAGQRRWGGLVAVASGPRAEHLTGA